MGLALAFLLAVTVAVDPASGAVSIEARAEPLGDVLASLRAATGVNLIVDGAIESFPVSIEGRYPDVGAAVRAIAGSVGVEAEEAGGVFLVRKVRPPPAGAAAIRIVEEGEGRYRAPGLLTYPVSVLRDRPADVTQRATLAGFEGRPGIALLVAPSLKERALREYLEARPVYRAILERAGVSIDLRGDLDVRSVRVYVEPAKGRYYDELIFSTGERGAEIAHFVYVLDAKTEKCEVLYVFKLPV